MSSQAGFTYNCVMDLIMHSKSALWRISSSACLNQRQKFERAVSRVMRTPDFRL